jgi:hypothetical protein
MRMPAGLAGSIARSQEVKTAKGVCGIEQVSLHQIARLIEQLQRVTREAESLAAGRDGADLAARLTPNSWSVAECLDHLTQTTRAFLPSLTDAVAAAPRLGTGRALRTGIFAALFIRNLEPPYRIRMKVLPQLMPKNHEFDPAWRDFAKSQMQLSETIFSATGLAIDKVKIKSPVYARFSYNVYGAFRMLVAHESRHLWQIRQILAEIDRRRS